MTIKFLWDSYFINLYKLLASFLMTFMAVIRDIGSFKLFYYETPIRFIQVWPKYMYLQSSFNIYLISVLKSIFQELFRSETSNV